MSTALAFFVKTIGLSPIKTRLAAEIGPAGAQEFYLRSVEAILALGRAIESTEPSVKVYWAVAEDEGISRWPTFPAIAQGEGGLGDRLHRIYSQLFERHGSVVLAGADSPHIALDVWLANLRQVQSDRSFHMGETDDGGFYFFGGGREIPAEVWTSVAYSQNDTAHKLKESLARVGSVSALPQDFDIDTGEDLRKYITMEPNENWLPEQTELVAWAKRSFAK